MKWTLAEARALDGRDVLAPFRREFHLPKTKAGRDCLYMCGNSLGLQPKATAKYVREELDDWARLGVEGHFHARRPWLPYHEVVTKSLARLAGAKPHEVVAMNSLTVNVHLLWCAFYRPTLSRPKVLIEESAFPSDEYAVVSQLRMRGLDPSTTLIKVPPATDAVLDALDYYGSSVALVWIGQVNYLTGYAFDVKAIAARAHHHGSLMGVDLAHGIGNLELSLHDDDVDFAAWCSYKYLNAGPGGIAGAFVHERHGLNPDQFRLAGWWGHDKATRFVMGPDFHPIPGAEGWQLSNPPIFQLAALRASLDVFDRAGMPRIRRKRDALVRFLELGLRTELPHVRVVTPSSPRERGTQLSLQVPDAPKRLTQRLIERGAICDFREPDVVRVAPVALYTRFEDVFKFVRILRECVA